MFSRKKKVPKKEKIEEKVEEESDPAVIIEYVPISDKCEYR